LNLRKAQKSVLEEKKLALNYYYAVLTSEINQLESQIKNVNDH
jgi:phosphoenolpyruvate carboxylase